MKLTENGGTASLQEKEKETDDVEMVSAAAMEIVNGDAQEMVTADALEIFL